MAKKKVSEEMEEKKRGGGKFFFFGIFIPLLFIITASYIGLTMSGVNVNEKISSLTSKVPFIGSSEGNLESANQEQSNQEMQAQVKSLNEKVKAKEKNINDLEEQLKAKEREIDELQIKIRDAEDQQEAAANTQGEVDQDSEKKDIISTYEKMAPKQAALIFSELKESEALLLLKSLKSDTRTGILEKMDPALAARYTSLLAEPLSQ